MKEKENNEEEKIILIAKMYTGGYIENNIGHEIINFFKPDNIDSYYGYITYNGKVNPKKSDKIHKILFVSNIKGRKVKVLAKIENPEFIINTDEGNTHKKQIKYIEKENIKYNNVLLSDIMQESGLDEYGIYITYKAEKIEEPNEDYYILLNDNKEEEKKENHIKTSWNIGHNIGYISNIKNEKDYKIIDEFLNKKIWKEKEIKEIKEINPETMKEYASLGDNEESFMDLIKKEYDESTFSNMLFYYFDKKKMFKDFAKHVFNLELSDNIKINREKSTFSDSKNGRIDLFVEDKKNKVCIVIENKIKSAINGRDYTVDEKTDKIVKRSQLYKYMEWVNEEKDKNGIKKYTEYSKNYFIFVPNYREEELRKHIQENNLMPKDNGKDVYKIITYKEIFNYFNQEELKLKMKEDKYYKDFVKALSKHIYTADKEMERKFINAINKVLNR